MTVYLISHFDADDHHLNQNRPNEFENIERVLKDALKDVSKTLIYNNKSCRDEAMCLGQHMTGFHVLAYEQMRPLEAIKRLEPYKASVVFGSQHDIEALLVELDRQQISSFWLNKNHHTDTL